MKLGRLNQGRTKEVNYRANSRMVTSFNGLQLVGFVCLFFASFLSSEGASALTLARVNYYGTNDNSESLSPEELTPKQEIPRVTPLDREPGTLDAKGVALPPSGNVNNEGNDEAWPRTKSPSGRRAIRNILEDGYPLTTSEKNDEYRIDVENLLKDDYSSDQNQKYGSSGLQNVRAFGKKILPLLRPQQSPESSQLDNPNQNSRKSEAMLASSPFSYPLLSPTSMRNRVYGEQPPSKRWWGPRFKPRPKMDRRAAQSKHYGCLKRCISTGKLHPIQCHTLC